MLLFVEFDISADIIDVPECVIQNKERLQSQFLKWMFQDGNKHKYWVTINGHRGVCYRSEAFVDWLNGFILLDPDEKATVVQQYVPRKNVNHLPSLFF